jgi:oligopeptide/dipeptide ABC transporter ATP-binding protein
MDDRNINTCQSLKPLVRIENLKKYFPIRGRGYLHAVDGVNLDIMPKETVGLVGESGCGKSTIGKLIVTLIPATSGRIMLEDEDILASSKNNIRNLSRKVQMIFQDPYSSLNPRSTIRNILQAPFKIHGMTQDLQERIKRLIEMAGLEPYVLDKYPHELDGGKRQMVGIARALALDPPFIVCDEPISALDVSVQATIINLLIDLQKKMGLTFLFISHDLSVVRHISNHIAVMYLGEIVEFASTDQIFLNTSHPYTIALLSAVPKIDFYNREKRIVLTGDVPSPLNPDPGCRFAPRCWMANERCRQEQPKLAEIEPGHKTACHYWEDSRERARKLTKAD